MSSTLLGAAIANVVISVRAVQQSLKNQHSLTAFASKLRWTAIFAGVAEFFLSLRFLGTGRLGRYVAFLAGLAAGFLLFFPDASYDLAKMALGFKNQRACLINACRPSGYWDEVTSKNAPLFFGIGQETQIQKFAYRTVRGANSFVAQRVANSFRKFSLQRKTNECGNHD